MITDISQLDLNKKYTYADYLTWQFEDRVELIRGKVSRMSPAPNLSHQKISSNLHVVIGSYLRNKSCMIFSAPFDVRLPLPVDQQTPDKIDTVVQPDLFIICDPSKLDTQGCNGAPDWIIEILSPATSKKDLTEKFDIYQHAGVQEYWVVYPSEKTVSVFQLDTSGAYQLARITPFVEVEVVPVGVFEDDGFEVDLGEVFG